MTEEMIRRQTEKLLAAYRTLTGRHGNPTYDEFLMLRSRAITELEEHISDDTESCDYEPPVTETTNIKKKPNDKPKKEKQEEKEYKPAVIENIMETVSKAPSYTEKKVPEKTETPPAEKRTNIVNIKTQHNITDTEDDEDEDNNEHELSDFDILSRLADPWNS